MITEETPLGEESKSGPDGPDETRWKVSEDADVFSSEDLAQKVDGDEWKSIDWQVLHRIVREAAIQQLMGKLYFDRQTASDAAEEMLRGFTDWRIPDM